MVNAKVYNKLIQVAKAGKTIANDEMAKIADLQTENRDEMKILDLILDTIADQEIAAGRPLLPFVVVDELNSIPSGRLFKYARRKKLQETDDLTFFTSELQSVHKYWATAAVPKT